MENKNGAFKFKPNIKRMQKISDNIDFGNVSQDKVTEFAKELKDIIDGGFKVVKKNSSNGGSLKKSAGNKLEELSDSLEVILYSRLELSKITSKAINEFKTFEILTGEKESPHSSSARSFC